MSDKLEASIVLEGVGGQGGDTLLHGFAAVREEASRPRGVRFHLRHCHLQVGGQCERSCDVHSGRQAAHRDGFAVSRADADARKAQRTPISRPYGEIPCRAERERFWTVRRNDFQERPSRLWPVGLQVLSHNVDYVNYGVMRHKKVQAAHQPSFRARTS